MNGMVAAVAGRRPKTLVPFLAGLFIVAWALLILLVVMQDRMIDAQSELIHSFFKGNVPREEAKPTVASRRLEPRPATIATTAGGEVAHKGLASGTSTIPGRKPAESISQIPLSQKALSQSPSSQVKAKPADKTARNARRGRSPFSPPPVEITDPSDQRRVSITI